MRPVSGGGCAEASLTGLIFAWTATGPPGVKRLSDFDDNRHPRSPAGKGARRPKGGEVGDALRKVYDRTLREDIPPEMLDLLGKLD